MKTRVNLFTNEYKPKMMLVTLGFAGVIWVMTALLIAVFAFVAHSAWRVNADAADPFVEQYEEKQSMISVLTQTRDDRSHDETLMAKVETLQKQVAARILLIKELEKKEQLKNQGFSLLLSDLAKYHQNDIWLRRIRVSEQQMQLSGGAANAAAVPQWIKNLKQAHYFNGRKFAAAKLYRDELDTLQFDIGAKLSPLISGAAANE